MDNLAFKCLKCGLCCHEISGIDDKSTYKRIPIYPEEAIRLERFAEENEIELHIIEDIVFPDIKNSKIQVLSYRILLDNLERVCPFYNKQKGCIINSSKPQSCLAYPLAVKTIDAFNMNIEIDPLCNFTMKHYDTLTKVNTNSVEKIYGVEYEHARNMLKRNKRAIFNLLALEKEGKIVIPKTIQKEEYERYLKEWDRVELNSLEEKDNE